MKICRVPADSRRNLEAEIAKNQEALDKATALRKEELAEFNAEEKDMLQSIGALKSEVVVLSDWTALFSRSTARATRISQWHVVRVRITVTDCSIPVQGLTTHSTSCYQESLGCNHSLL